MSDDTTPHLTGRHGQLAHPDLIQFRPELVPEIIRHGADFLTIFGLSLANCHVIIAHDGLIVVDAGHSADEGRELQKLIRSVSDKPIIAVLLTHSHYVNGLTTMLDGDAAAIYAHPLLDPNYQRARKHGRAAGKRRAWLETGKPLPATGANAVVAPAKGWPSEPAYLEPTHLVRPGEQIQISNHRIDIWPGCFDTNDGLAFHIPALDAVAHNLVVSQLPNFGSLGGGRYRDPLLWIEAMEFIHDRPPEFLLPCHGRPLTGRERVRERLRVNLLAVQHLYNGVCDTLGAGGSLADCIRDVQLPPELKQHADLKELYGTAAHMVAAFAVGEMGFWTGDARDLIPLHPDEEAQQLMNLCGGPQQLRQQAAAAQNPAWALHLADAACRAAVPQARELRARLLRQAGHNCSAWTLRNTLLSLAEEDSPSQ